MLTALILDAAAVAVVILFAVLGARRGFVLTLCGLLAYFVALAGAWALTEMATPWLSQKMEPQMEALVARSLTENVTDAAQADESGIWDLLRGIGLEEQVTRALEGGSQAAAASVAQPVAQMLARVILLVGGFVLVLALWRLISRGLDLAARLPGLHFANRFLGGVLGAAKGVVAVYLLVIVLHMLGILGGESLQQTYLLRILTRFDPFYEMFG